MTRMAIMLRKSALLLVFVITTTLLFIQATAHAVPSHTINNPQDSTEYVHNHSCLPYQTLAGQGDDYDYPCVHEGEDRLKEEWAPFINNIASITLDVSNNAQDVNATFRALAIKVPEHVLSSMLHNMRERDHKDRGGGITRWRDNDRISDLFFTLDTTVFVQPNGTAVSRPRALRFGDIKLAGRK